MKMVAGLAILFLAVVLASGAALAQPPCTCYEVSTACDSGFSSTNIWELCDVTLLTDGDFGDLQILIVNGHKWVGYGDGSSGCPGGWIFDVKKNGSGFKANGSCLFMRCAVNGRSTLCDGVGVTSGVR